MNLKRAFCRTLVALCFGSGLQAQQTVGLLLHSTGSLDSGYVLYSPLSCSSTYLIDKCGHPVHSWKSAYNCGMSVYLLPDGTLLRTGSDEENHVFAAPGRGGYIERQAWDGQVLWHYKISDTLECQHHDIEPLPNGNVLAVVWERKSNAEAIAAGRDPALLDNLLWPEKIVEIRPNGVYGGEIVWEWHVWDHLVQDFNSALPGYDTVSRHPERININHLLRGLTASDWIHMNSVKYNPELDQIMLSAHHFGEIWIIDHSTTTQEAASSAGGKYGKGGDLLYRWGNPAAYNQGTRVNQKLFGQHDAYWIPAGYPKAGKIMVFNNNNGNATFSSVDILSPPVDKNGNYDAAVLPYLPLASDWSYTAPVPTNFHSTDISGAQMLSNGNVLICEGNRGLFFEVDSNKNMVWKYLNPTSDLGTATQGVTPFQAPVFRCAFYPASFPGLVGRLLTPGAPIELNPLPYDCVLNTGSTRDERSQPQAVSFSVFPGPASGFLEIRGPVEGCRLQLFDMKGQRVAEAMGQRRVKLPACANGLYLLRLTTPSASTTQKIAILR